MDFIGKVNKNKYKYLWNFPKKKSKIKQKVLDTVLKNRKVTTINE